MGTRVILYYQDLQESSLTCRKKWLTGLRLRLAGIGCNFIITSFTVAGGINVLVTHVNTGMIEYIHVQAR